jgi:CRP-like cAMP-binding protein
MHERSYGDGESIFEQGTPSAALYLIRNGSVELTRKTAGMDSVLATLGPNELFGEISLLIEEGPRHAGARSRGPSDLLALSRPDFETLMAKSPLVSVRFLRALAGIVAERFRLLMEAIEGGSVE